MSVSSGSDVTIPIQDSPPPPPSPYANQKGASKGEGERLQTAEEPAANGGVTSCPAALQNEAEAAEGPNGRKKSHTEIPMSEYSNGTGQSPPLAEAVNSELVNVNVLDTIPHKPSSEFGPYENFDDYFISVNQHKKFLRRGEKLYVTKDKRKATQWRKYACWFFGAFLLASIVTVAVLAAVGLIPQKSSTGSFSMIDMTTSTPWPDSSSSEASDEFSSSSSTLSSTTDTTLGINSTTPALPPSDIYVPSAAEIQLILDNGEYEADLGDPASAKFHQLADEVQMEVTNLLETEGNVGTAYARVTSFSSGSIVAKLKIGWTDEGQDYSAVQKLVSGWKQINNYELRQGTTTFNHLFNFCTISNGGCSDGCSFDYQSLDFICTCPDTKLLAADKKNCEEFSPTNGTDTLEPQVTSAPTESLPAEPSVAPTVPAAPASTSTSTTPSTTSAPPTTAPPSTSTTPSTTSAPPSTAPPSTSTTPSTTSAPQTEAPPTTSTTPTTTTTTTTTVAPEAEVSEENGRSLLPIETTAGTAVEAMELENSTSLPHTPMEDYNTEPEVAVPDPAQPPVVLPLPTAASTITTTTTTTERPMEAAGSEIETASHETPTPPDTTITPMDVLEIEMPSKPTPATTTTTTARPQDPASAEDESINTSSNSQSFESEVIVAATSTTTTTSTTQAPPVIKSEEQSVESESSNEGSSLEPSLNLTFPLQSRKTARAETSAFLSAESAETEAPVTGTPVRPHSGSDEFMAFSDANMTLLNSKLLNQTTTTTTPSPLPEGGSYENVSGGGDTETVPGTGSDEAAPGSGSLEEPRSQDLLNRAPELIPIPTTTAPTPISALDQAEPIEASRERESMETAEGGMDSLYASQERTTIQPISLQNDTVVNELPGVTEDTVNTEPVVSGEEIVMATDIPSQAEGSVSVEEAEGQTTTTPAPVQPAAVPPVDSPIQPAAIPPVDSPVQPAAVPPVDSAEALSGSASFEASEEQVTSTTTPIPPPIQELNGTLEEAQPAVTTTTSSTSTTTSSTSTTTTTTVSPSLEEAPSGESVEENNSNDSNELN